MGSKLSNEIVDERLKDRTIHRIGKFIDTKTKINFGCKKCGHVWKAKPNIILNGRGCPKCGKKHAADKLRHSNETIDEKLKNRFIFRIGEYVNTGTKILFGCKKCGYEWNVAPNSILRNHGCPKCANLLPLNNDVLDARLEKRMVYRIGNYINTYTKILFGCKLCGNRWDATPTHILDNRGCPICNNKTRAKKRMLTNNMVDSRIINRKIHRIDDYVNTKEKIAFGCDVCGYIWKANAMSVVHGCGCPKCANQIGLTNEIIDERLKNRELYRVGKYIRSNSKIEFGCKKCGTIWKATTNNVISKQSGCPICTSNKKTEKKVYEFLKTVLSNKKIKYQKTEKYNKINKFVFDFCINHAIIIEYNGKQHYMPITFFGGDEQFKRQQKRDKKLRKYCERKGYHLLEIPYTMKEKEWKAKILEFLSQHVSLENPIQQSA